MAKQQEARESTGYSLSVYLPIGKRGSRIKVFKEIDRMAAKRDRSRSYIVNEAIAQFCDRHEAKAKSGQ